VLSRDRGTAIVAGCFVVALAVAATLLFTRSGDPAKLDWTDGTAVPTSLPLGVTVVDNHVPVAVAPGIETWTGSELLVLGARGSRNVGAVYEPATGRWRAMSPVPFLTALRAPGGVWTGSVWVVVGILCRVSHSPCDGALAAATYDPDTDTWSPIDASPQPAAGNGRGHDRFFGRGIGMLGTDAAFLIDGQYYAFRPDARDWDWLPQPKSADPPACSANGVLAAYNSDGTVSEFASGANAWTTASGRAPVAVTAGSVVCTRNDVLVSASDLSSVASFDLGAHRWSVVPSPSFVVAEPLDGGLARTTVLFAGRAQAVAYDIGSRAWRAAPSGLTERPDLVAWTQHGYGLYVTDAGTLDVYNPGA
jgi:hypothetical protein